MKNIESWELLFQLEALCISRQAVSCPQELWRLDAHRATIALSRSHSTCVIGDRVGSRAAALVRKRFTATRFVRSAIGATTAKIANGESCPSWRT